MQFSVAAVLALVGSALAQTPNFNPLTAPGMNEVIPAGKPYTIKWTPQGGNGAPVSLYAYAGNDAASLQEIGTIATGIEATLARFDWNIESSLGGKYKAYGIKIALASNKEVYQWSNPFTIAADPSAPSTSASSSAASSTASGFTVKTDSPASTTTKASTTTSAPVTSATVVSSAPISNLSTTAGSGSGSGANTQTTLISTSTSRPTGPAGTTGTSPVATGAAVAKGASSIAVIGGLAMAVLAL